MVPAPPSTPLPPTFPDRHTGLTPASSSDVRRKRSHHQETQRLPFVKKMHGHRGGEHGLSDQEQLQKPEFCGCLGFILHFSVNNTTAFSYLQRSLGLWARSPMPSPLGLT